MNNPSVAFPAVRYEPRPWSPRLEMISKTQARRHSGPYHAAVPPAIAAAAIVLPSELAAETEAAAAALARFDTGFPVVPLPAILLRTESAASSQIENLTVGARQLAAAAIGAYANRNARLVTANVQAMQTAIQPGGLTDHEAILAMHAELLGKSDPAHAGRWRQEQVWIGGANAGPHRATFIPPHHERVPGAMEDLARFIARDDLPAIAHIAIAHAQFETIHPFTDGNGRTGRALVHRMLAAKELTPKVTVPISAGLLTQTASYFGALTSYRAGDIVPIIRTFTDAAHYAIGAGHALISELHLLREDFRGRITARADSAVWPLVDLLLTQPVVNIAYLTAALGVSDVAAQRAVDRLIQAGVLQLVSPRERDRLWQSAEILAVLDDFAASVRRVRD